MTYPKLLAGKKYHDTLVKTFNACGKLESKVLSDWMDAAYEIHVSEQERAEMWKVIEALRTIRGFASKTCREAGVEI